MYAYDNIDGTSSIKSFWVPMNSSVTVDYSVSSSSYSYTVPITGWTTSSNSNGSTTRHFTVNISDSPASLYEAQKIVYVPSYSTGYLLEYKIGTYSD